VENWLYADFGVFEFFMSGTRLETPYETVMKMSAERRLTGETHRYESDSSSDMDPLMMMYYESEIARVQERYENWCQSCLNFLCVLKDPRVVDRDIMDTVQTHPDWSKWNTSFPPDLHSIAIQLMSVSNRTVQPDPYLLRLDFERSLRPYPNESVVQLLARVDGLIRSLNLAKQVKIPEDELIARVIYNALDSYPHMKEFLIPYKTGEKKMPNTYGDFKALVSAHDLAKIYSGIIQDNGYENDLKDSKEISIKTTVATTAVNHGKKRHSEKRVACQFCGKLGHSAKQCLVLAKTSEPKSMDRQHNDYESRKSPRDYFKNSGSNPISKSCTADETCSNLWTNLSAEDSITAFGDNLVQSFDDNPILASDTDISDPYIIPFGESAIVVDNPSVDNDMLECPAPITTEQCDLSGDVATNITDLSKSVTIFALENGSF